MSDTSFQVASLDETHVRASFGCGVASLDGYFHKQVTQDIRRKVTACFVALTDQQRVAGYYTLASASIPLAGLPSDLSKKLPRYPMLPAVRMGRLAVDQAFAGRGLGGALLADALARAAHAEIAAYALLVDAKDEAAAAFYRHHGFIAFADSPLTLFLPLAAIASQLR